MPPFGFIGPYNTLQNIGAESSDCCNLYPESVKPGVGPSGATYTLQGRPGLTAFCTLPDGPVRCLWGGNNRLFAVGGGHLYEISSAGAILQTYTIAGSGPAQIVFVIEGISGVLLVYDGSDGSTNNIWYVDGSTSTPPTVASGVAIGYIDGYAVILRPPVPPGNPADLLPLNTFDGTQVNLSGLLAANTYDPLQYAFRTGAPDQVVMIGTPGLQGSAGPEELWWFGKKTIEVWYDTGGTAQNPFPFQRVPGAFINQGVWARFSIANLDGSYFFLGGDDRGFGVVYRMNGYIPQRVSTHAVEYAIQQYALAGSDISDAIAYAYQEAGHQFYVLNFPTANATWVYDVTENLWHRRASGGIAAGQIGFYHASTFGQHFLGDGNSANIYVSSLNTFQDAGNPITFFRRAPHVDTEFERQVINRLTVLIGASSGSRTFTLGISRDQGLNFPVTRTVTFPGAGNPPPPNQWITFKRLGQARDWIFELSSTDNVQQSWIEAFIK